MDSLEQAFRDLVELFDELALTWYVFGAQASNIYGTPRATADVDVTFEPPPQMSTFIEALGRHGFEPRVDDPVQMAETVSVLPAIHTATGIPIDFVVGRSGLEAEFLTRTRTVPLEPDLLVPIISPEDLIISKILAGRPKDLADAKSVFLAEKPLDIDRVRGVLQLLEEALGQSDLVRVLHEWERG